MSPIIRRANSVEKMQVFWPWSSLRISAWTVPRTVCRVRPGSLRTPLRGLAAVASRKPSTCWSMAALKKKASIIGAGPLIVSDTLVFGVAEVESGEQLLHVVDGADAKRRSRRPCRRRRADSRGLRRRGSRCRRRWKAAWRRRPSRDNGSGGWSARASLRPRTGAWGPLRPA